MESIKVRQRVGADGMLRLELPVGLTDVDVEVMVIYQPVPSVTGVGRSLASLYGICADDPIEMGDRGLAKALNEDWAGGFD